MKQQKEGTNTGQCLEDRIQDGKWWDNHLYYRSQEVLQEIIFSEKYDRNLKGVNDTNKKSGNSQNLYLKLYRIMRF